MGNFKKVEVTESLEALKKIKSKIKTAKGQKRIECLMIFKSYPFKTKENVAYHLLVTRKTIHTWLELYKAGGIEQLLPATSRDKKSKLITAEIHEGLRKKLFDSEQAFLGYWQAHKWVKQTYGIEISYQWLREYLIKHFKSKLKTGRKSHYKKDEQAVEVFLKTA